MVRRSAHNSVKSCFDTCCIFVICIGFFALAAGISITVVGAAGTRDDPFSSSSYVSDPIGDYNSKTRGFAESIVTGLSGGTAIAYMSSTKGTPQQNFQASNFVVRSRAVKLEGEISRISTFSETTSYFLETTFEIPNTGVVKDDPELFLEDVKIALDMTNVASDSGSSSSSFFPSIDLFRRGTSLGSFWCNNPGGCDLAYGQAQCVAKYPAARNPVYIPNSIIRNGGTCSGSNSLCGSCYTRLYASCFSIVLSRQSSSAIGSFGAPLRPSVNDCVGYRSSPLSSTYRSPPTDGSAPTVTLQIIVDSDPYYQAMVGSKSYTATAANPPTTTAAGAVFTMVDEKKKSDAEKDDEKSGKKTLMIVGIIILVVSGLMMCMGIVCLSCGGELRWCLLHGGNMDGYGVPIAAVGPCGGGGGVGMLQVVEMQQHTVTTAMPTPLQQQAMMMNDGGGIMAPPPPGMMMAPPQQQQHMPNNYGYNPQQQQYNHYNNAAGYNPNAAPPQHQYNQQQLQQEQQPIGGFFTPSNNNTNTTNYNYGYGQQQQQQQQQPYARAHEEPMISPSNGNGGMHQQQQYYSGNQQHHPNQLIDQAGADGGAAIVGVPLQQQQVPPTASAAAHQQQYQQAPQGYQPPPAQASGVAFGGNPSK